MLASRVSFIARSVARQPFMLQAVSQRTMATAVDMKINATESKPVEAVSIFLFIEELQDFLHLPFR